MASMAAPGMQAGGMVGYWKRREDEDENDEGLGQGLLDPDEPLAHASGAQEPAWLIRFRAALVLLGSLTFLASTSFIPVFNKRLFAKDFHYPLFTTSVYLLLCVLGGAIYFLARWAVGAAGRRQTTPHYATWAYWRNVVRATWLLGLVFGAKLGLTNYGLDLVSVDYHVLFAATALIWVALFGWVVLGEKPTVDVSLLCLSMVAGQILLGLQFQKESSASFLGLSVNLLAPAMQGVCVVLMRYTSVLLFPEWMTRHRASLRDVTAAPQCLMEDFPETFGFQVDTLVAYTAVKLLFSFLACVPAALLMEGVYADRPFWQALGGTDARALAVDLLIGGAVTFFLQASLVLLSMVSVALTLGVLGSFKIVPQLAAGIVAGTKAFEWSAQHVAGVLLVVLSSLGYMVARIIKFRRSKQQQ